MQNKLFKKSSVERFSSPEKLNDYIQVANPSSWIVLGAALALLLGVLIWGFFGEITDSMSFNGMVREGTLGCFVNGAESAALSENMEVTILPVSGDPNAAPFKGTIASVSEHPLSYQEAAEGIEGDYLMDTLGISTWNIVVEIETEEPLYEGVIYTVTAVTDTQRPIDMVFE
ncbi:MAG: hypothetical protein IJE08_00300 [Clostridia bacterium]|nr:hypothetical protein [Clostridia bacterium]